MNKKISTMFASTLLMVGAVFSTADAQVSKTVDLYAPGSNYYYIGLPAAAGQGSTAYLKAVEVENTVGANKGKTFISLEGETTVDQNEIDAYLFQIEKVSDGALVPTYYFKLKSKEYGTYVVFKGGTDLTEGVGLTATSLDLIAAGDDENAVKTYVNQICIESSVISSDKKKAEVKANTGMVFVPFTIAGTNANTDELKLDASGTPLLTVEASTGGTKLQFFGVSTETVAASDLNGTLKNGFILNAKDVEDNIFADQTIKAFTVSGSSIQVDGSDYTIPEGTYFATSYPKELASANVTTISDPDLFRQCTFIALDPVTNLNTKKDDTQKAEQKAGKNFGLKLVDGDDFNFYTETDEDAAGYAEKISQGSQVSVYNAIFKVETNKDNEDKYSLTVEKFRYKKEADKNAHGEETVRVAISTIDDEKVLATATGDAQFAFTLGDVPVVKPIDLLNDSTASVYNIRFVSGEKADSEKGKYLGVTVKAAGTYIFSAQGSAIAELGNPQYQFVISDVNAEDNEITFTNRETGEDFTCVLFSTDEENQYLVADGNSTQFTVANLKKDGSVEYASNAMNLEGTTIELTKATVDKFAGFANRSENDGYTFIKFALDNVSDDNLFMMVLDNGTPGAPAYDVEKATDKEELASLFELVKSEKPLYIRNNYAYEKDDVATIKTKADTVAYYTYAIKWINPELDKVYYLNHDLDVVVATSDDPADEDQFIIKENKDGSVYIVKEGELDENGEAIACDENGVVTIDAVPYIIEDADAVKSYLSAEQLGASLEAKEQHVAFKSTTGGYLSMNEDAEGVVAIKTAADEDLTFWLDTADIDATLPSFFISKGVKDAEERMFMYFAEDSADYYINNPHYRFDNGSVKMIFKAGTLTNSDTLATTVNGKAVNVSVEPNADGTLGGLNNFKFQIFKANEGDDDAYVIRCKENNKYLTSTNGLLTLGSRANAIKVYAEFQEAPTANEGVEVAGVKVIAGNGQLTIAGAAGKKVVISNILGQVVANTVVSSDNATIAAPQGIVVVAVEGEEAVKAIVK